MLQIYAHRAQCVHFITQQKLTNHYNKSSTIKAKPLIFSGLALFFTFFKPRHAISVKKLRANRRFPPFSAVFTAGKAPSVAVTGLRVSSGRPVPTAIRCGEATGGCASVRRCGRCGCRGRRRAPADDMSDALRPPVGSPRSCGSRC